MRKICWFPVALSLLLGCDNGQLTRSTASKEIEGHFKDNVSVLVIETGRIGSRCSFVDNRTHEEKNEDLSPDKALNIVVANKAGYVSFVPDGDGYWKLSLTSRGEAAQDPEWRKAPYHNQLKGCDYRFAGFVVAKPELVRITGITGAATSPEVEFEWKWNATELGAALRENGAIYTALTPEQKRMVRYAVQGGALKLPIPVPQQDQVEKETVTFKRYDDGWRSQ